MALATFFGCVSVGRAAATPRLRSCRTCRIRWKNTWRGARSLHGRHAGRGRPPPRRRGLCQPVGVGASRLDGRRPAPDFAGEEVAMALGAQPLVRHRLHAGLDKLPTISRTSRDSDQICSAPETIAWLRSHDVRSQRTCSVCTGAFCWLPPPARRPEGDHPLALGAIAAAAVSRDRGERRAPLLRERQVLDDSGCQCRHRPGVHAHRAGLRHPRRPEGGTPLGAVPASRRPLAASGAMSRKQIQRAVAA